MSDANELLDKLIEERLKTRAGMAKAVWYCADYLHDVNRHYNGRSTPEMQARIERVLFAVYVELSKP